LLLCWLLLLLSPDYFGIRRLTRKDLGFTPVKRYASKLAKTLLHTEATARVTAEAKL